MDHLELRKQVIDACRMLQREGYIFGTWGNISVRLEDGNILITPSRLDYEAMQPEDLPVISPDGTVVSGIRLPTSEREIHRGIMLHRPDVGAIVHAHSTYAMACCALDGGIPVFSEEMCQLIGGAVPITQRFVPSDDHVALGEEACRCLTPSNALLIRNHGPVAMGVNLEEALLCCRVLEKSAEIYLHLLQSGKDVSLLSEDAILRGRDYYANKYGKT